MSLHSLIHSLIRQIHFSFVHHRLRVIIIGLVTLAACSLGLAGIANIRMPQGSLPVTTVSAASYEATAIAPDSIVAAFGTNLATQTAVASTVPLPTSLGGTTVEVNGQQAQLFFVSPGQVNFIIPSGISPGSANIVVRAGNNITSNGTAQISQAGAALFSANADGQGVPAALLLRVKSNGQQIYESVSQLNQSTGRLVTKPIDLGPEGEHVFLVLFLSGIRKAPDPNNDGNVRENVRVILGGGEITPDYAGSQGGFVGLDQINVEIPRGLIGRGKVNLGVTVTGFGSSNLGEIEIAGAPGSSPPVVTGFGSANVLAGQTLAINGSGFSANMSDNTVRIGGTEATLNSASSTQLSVTVPFGVETGAVSVRTPQGEGSSASALPVRTSVSGFIEDTSRQPMSGVTVKLLGAGSITTTTNSEGLFILPDAPAGAALVEIDGTTVTSPPYPKVILKMSIAANRDNQFSQPVAMQQATGPGLPVGTGGGSTEGDSEGTQATSEVNGSIQAGGVTLDVPPGSAVFPDGSTGGTIFLTIIENSRTPVGLPAGFFSTSIAQITPFGVTLNPGGKLTFPNPDNLPAGTKAKLFRFDQTSNSPSVGQFIEAGEAIVSPDGQRIETVAGAVTRTGIYFVSVQLPTTTVIGRVLESGGTAPVRRVLVRARGREAFTDGNGGFILRNVPVRPGESISVEASFLRASGRIERKQSNSVPAVPGGITIITPAIELPSATINRPPAILAPFNLTVNEGELTDARFVAADPDRDQSVNVTVAGAGFASVIKGIGDFYTLRLTPGFSDAGSYNLMLTVTDSLGLSTTRNISLTIKDVNRQPSLTSPGNKTVAENSPLSFTLSGNDPDTGQTLTYSMTNAPAGATLDSSTGVFSYTPPFTVASQSQPSVVFNVTFTVTDSGTPARSASQTIGITVTNVNRAPTATPQGVTLNEDTPTNITLMASDLDGDALTWTIVNKPLHGTLTGTAPNVTYTPALNYFGSDSFSFRVSDGLLNSNEPLVSLTINSVNDPPVLTVPGAQVVNEGQSLRFTVSATDVENNQITLTATGVPSGATFDTAAGIFSWTPGFTDAGTYTVSFKATDNGSPAASDTKSVTITVNDFLHDLATDPENFAVFGSDGDASGDNGDFTGASVATGDLNGDGIPDLVIGAPFANGSGIDNGRVYVIFGKLSNGLLDLQKQSPDVTLIGQNANDHLGVSVAIGDLNGDGLNDLIVGAPGADALDALGRPKADCGKAYAVFGKLTAGTSTIDKVAGLTIIGNNGNDQLGSGVAVGRVTQKSGPADLIVGAPLYDAPGAAAPLTDAGRVYLFAGGAGLTGTIDVATNPATFTITGQIPFGQIGSQLATGDVNGDGLAEIAIGEPLFDSQSQRGALYMVYGAATLSGNRSFGGSSSDLSVIGRDPGDRLGTAVAIGDVNGDGRGDLIIGAPGSDGFGNSNFAAGEVNVLLGSDRLVGTLDLAKDPVDLVIYGAPNNGDGALGLGSSIAIGDFTGDGIADLMIGSPGAGPRFECGAIYLIPGAKSVSVSLIDLSKTNAPLTIFGADNGDRIGESGMVIGELNASSPADLVIGIPKGDSISNLRNRAGEVRILFGRPR
ncbi:MAG TPA: Ig-like domain-containing protein [Blastocatellia bacterium]|nr:Ig-like domain-containing protein [Blastocatellia bacterium]